MRELGCAGLVGWALHHAKIFILVINKTVDGHRIRLC